MPIFIRLAVLAGMWFLKKRTSGSQPAVVQEVGALSWPSKASLAWRLARDRRVPLWTRAFAFLPALYLVSPIDLLPDFIPFVGRLDDALVFALVSDTMLRFVPLGVLQEHVSALSPASRPRR